MLGSAIPTGILSGAAAAAWALHLGSGWPMGLVAYSVAGSAALLLVGLSHWADHP